MFVHLSSSSPKLHNLEFQEMLSYLAFHFEADLSILVNEKNHWLMAIHPEYGILGGLCLTPPGNKLPFDTGKSTYTPCKEWVASHLAFCLNDDILDDLSDEDLHKIQTDFYSNLYNKLTCFAVNQGITRFILVSNRAEYEGVSQIGSWTVEQPRALTIQDKDEDYVIGMLPISDQAYSLFLKRKVHNRHHLLKHASIVH